ncbi:MAG: PorT family protein, partial [Salinivirgaceae bacterium]|nr:PorT family protein [Salinivirgaceae bacterium]
DTVYSVEYSGGALFGASMVFNLKLADNWDLRTLPGLAFSQRTLTYLLDDELVEPDKALRSHKMKIETTLLQFPTLIKYRSTRESNYRPYIYFGLNPAIDLAARKKVKPEERPKIRLNKLDVYAEIGIGLDNYLKYFKYSTELKFSYGLLDMVKQDGTEYTRAYRRLGSKMVTLVLCFE